MEKAKEEYAKKFEQEKKKMEEEYKNKLEQAQKNMEEEPREHTTKQKMTKLNELE